jgi:hypothetical protein
MRKSINVTEETWTRVSQIKLNEKFKSMEDVVIKLLENQKESQVCEAENKEA